MENAVSIPLKKTSDLDLVKLFKVAINAQYGNVDDQTKQSLEKLNELRSNAVAKFQYDTRQDREVCLETLQKYYDQLSCLSTKLPEPDVSFKWKDAFDKGGLIFSASSLTLPSIGYEKICVLFNIGALMSNLAAFYAKDTLNGDESLKKAIQYFLSAAGVFENLQHTADSQVNHAELSFDLKQEVLLLLQSVMLAQAQEMFSFKAIVGKLKGATIAQLAVECSKLYGEVSKQLNAFKTSNKSVYDWNDVFIFKHNLYAGIQLYFQSLGAKDSHKYGLQIALLKQAIEQLKIAESKMPPGSSMCKSYLNKANQDLEMVSKDNDFIYHDKIPPFNTIPATEGKRVGEIKPVPEQFFPSEPKLFAHLLPPGVHLSMQKLEQYRNELVNREIANLRELSQTLNATLASLNLPAAIEDLKGAEVPQSLKDKAADIKAKGGLAQLDRLLSELPELLKRNQEILDEIDRSLKAEKESDDKLKSQFGDKWSRTPSGKLNQAWRDQIDKYQAIITKAIEADSKIKAKYQANIAKVKILASANDRELANAIPSGDHASSSNVSESSVRKLRELMNEVDSLKKQRDTIENDLKGIEIEEIKSKFLKEMDIHSDVNESSLSSETMASFYGELTKRARDNAHKQEHLIAMILSANDEFVAAKGSGGNKRDQFLKDLATAYDAYVELRNNLEEGTKFYNDLTQVLVNLQVKVNDFCFARKAEREELCKDLQNEIVNRPNPPAPEAPKYHQTETSASSAPAMPTGSYPFPAAAAPQPNPWGAYYPPPPLPSGYNPYMQPPQPPVNPYYPAQAYPGYPPAAPQGYPGYPPAPN